MKIWGEKVPGPIAPKNAFVGLSFARLCRLPQQELCQTNKEKKLFPMSPFALLNCYIDESVQKNRSLTI